MFIIIPLSNLRRIIPHPPCDPAEFPQIRIDYFRVISGQKPPLACFLSHVHSDHLLGLESLKSPFIYCSPATREVSRLVTSVCIYFRALRFHPSIVARIIAQPVRTLVSRLLSKCKLLSCGYVLTILDPVASRKVPPSHELCERHSRIT